MDDSLAGGGEEDMVYSEFLEGIAAVAHTKIPTPYITTAKRCESKEQSISLCSVMATLLTC